MIIQVLPSYESGKELKEVVNIINSMGIGEEKSRKTKHS